MANKVNPLNSKAKQPPLNTKSNEFANGGGVEVGDPETDVNKREGSFPTSLHEIIYKAVQPRGYSDDPEIIKQAVSNLFDDTPRDIDSKEREEMWAYKLGSNKPLELYEQSEFAPTITKGEDKNYLQFSNFNPSSNYIERVLEAVETKKNIGVNNIGVPLEDGRLSDVLANHSVFKGEDALGQYISLYDNWDFKNPALNSITRDAEIYQRTYYEENTLGNTKFDGLYLKEQDLKDKIKGEFARIQSEGGDYAKVDALLKERANIRKELSKISYNPDDKFKVKDVQSHPTKEQYDIYEDTQYNKTVDLYTNNKQAQLDKVLNTK